MSKLIIYFLPLNLKSQLISSSFLGWFKMIMNKYCNYVRKFMWQLCEWDRVDITHWFDNFQNCATMNCQKNVNSIPPTQLPHKFLYIVARFIHNYFESPNIYISISIASKQSDWFDSQFHNQLSHDIYACRQINWNRNKTTTTFVGQIA
jgi:hypothetical protein